MKALLTLTTLALAASPLSAIILTVPFQYNTNNIVTGLTQNAADFSPLFLGSGTAVVANGEGPTFYNTFTFTPTVSSTGGIENNYTFAAQFATGIDGFIALYLGNFNPLNPNANLVAFNNDSGPNIEQSSLSLPLAAAQQYVLVQTLNNADTIGTNAGNLPTLKTVTMNIGGPGNIDTPGFPPPEGIPFGVDSTLGLVVLGAVGALRLRRNRKA